MKKLLLLVIILNFSMFGCGSTDGYLNTSMVIASTDPSILDSDIVLHFNADGAKANSCAESVLTGIPAADSVDVKVVSRPYPNNTQPLALKILSATVYYTPVDPVTAARPLAPVYQVINLPVTNGGTVTVPIRVATQEQKRDFYADLNCSNKFYNYYTNIVLDIEEMGQKKTTVTTSVQLRFADYVDK